MDPDLVRQQEEEEAASRLRAMMAPPVTAHVVTAHVEPLVVLALAPVPHDSPGSSAVSTAAVAAAIAAPPPPPPQPPAQMAEIAAGTPPDKNAPPPAREASQRAVRRRPRGQGIWLATLYNMLLIAVGIGAGIVIGVRQNLSPLQEFFACAGVAYVLGLYSTVEWLRHACVCTLWRATDAALWPVSVTWITQLMALALATRFTDSLPVVIAETQIPAAWAVLAGGCIASYALALPSMREAVRQTRPPA